ncbi:MAG: hypothetical protein DMG54_08515 [Acidobacteria bacterium]|nr:MAG: hypothetical protein DMG54_08515 [Acidobacteriota bacterium]PYU48518.1 MAG: hypothetical protein DMG53_06655 [Acidobacteriota bacterium]PYU70880.1 MAG: hypothetical protein DMG52_24180 [Acidobacteriota bacterium]
MNKYLCFEREQARVFAARLAISSELQRFRIVTPLRVGNTTPTNCGSWVSVWRFILILYSPEMGHTPAHCIHRNRRTACQPGFIVANKRAGCHHH